MIMRHAQSIKTGCNKKMRETKLRSAAKNIKFKKDNNNILISLKVMNKNTLQKKK